MHNDDPTPTEKGDVPFGAMDLPEGYGSTAKVENGEGGRRDWRRDEKRRGRSRRGGRNRNRNKDKDATKAPAEGGE